MREEFIVGINQLFEHRFALSTERLVLNQITENDVKDIFEIFGSPKVTELTDFSTAQDLQRAKRITDYFLSCYEDKEQYRFAIRDNRTNKLIGTLGVFSISEDSRMAEIGFELNEKEWRKGYMSEALKAFCDFFFETLKGNRIEAVVTPGNEASCGILEKCGFLREGCYRNRDYFKGRFWDGIIYGLIAEDR